MNSYRPMKRNTIINNCLKNGEPVHHYTISKNIGRGGSGFTYLAQDETGKPCVIKEYIPFNNRYSFVRNSNDVLVFNSTVSESQKKTITNKLIQIATHEYDINHKAMITEAGDNSPYIFDFTTFSDTSSDVIYGLIQTVEGEVFSEYITHITAEEKIHLLLKVSDAIKYINSRGILHADLTPENIYINSIEQVQILDFGASMDIGKFRCGTTEDKKEFARNLLSTNVGSLSRYYCSENLLTFANSINFVSNDNESDINKIVDILSNNISYADDIYSFKQIILFTLIGAPEAKIYLSSMTVEEYICDKLKDDFNITVTHLLCKLVHTNEFDLNILTDFLKLIDYYRLQRDYHPDSAPNFSLSTKHKFNNSLDALDFLINLSGFSYLLSLMRELPAKIKRLFGAPFWFIRDLDLEFALTLCTFPLKAVDAIDIYSILKSTSIYIPDKDYYFIRIFYTNFNIKYIFCIDDDIDSTYYENIPDNDELTDRQLLAKKLLTDLYCIFEKLLRKYRKKSFLPSICTEILSKTIKTVINSGSDIVCYKESVKYEFFSTYYSEEEKASFIIGQIYYINLNCGYIKLPDTNMPKNIDINSLFFSSHSYYPEVIYTHSFDSEIKEIQKARTQIPFNFFVRYDNNPIFEKVNITNINGKYSESEFLPLKDVYGNSLNTAIIIGVPDKKAVSTLISTIDKRMKIICLIDDNYKPIKDKIHRILATLRHGGIKKEMLYKLKIHNKSQNKILSQKEIDTILHSSNDIFCINGWYYLSYQGCMSNFTPKNDGILTELLINFLSDNPEPSYRSSLFLDGIFSALHKDVLAKQLKTNNTTVFQEVITYLKSSNCTWLITTFTVYVKNLIIDSLDMLDNIIYSYNLSILRDIYRLEGLLNKKDFYDIENSLYDIKYNNKTIQCNYEEKRESLIYNFLPLQLKGNIATIPDGMLFISNIYFLHEGNKDILSCIQEIIFSDYTIYIGPFTFKQCKNLRKIRLPKNLQYLSRAAFEGCNKNIEIDWQNIDSFFSFYPQDSMSEKTRYTPESYMSWLQFLHSSFEECDEQKRVWYEIFL